MRAHQAAYQILSTTKVLVAEVLAILTLDLHEII